MEDEQIDKFTKELICLLVEANNEINTLTVKDVFFLSNFLQQKLTKKYHINEKFRNYERNFTKSI